MDSSIFGCDIILFVSIFYQLLIRYCTKFIRCKHPVCVSSILGMISTLGGYHAVHWGISRVHRGRGGVHEYIKGFHEYIEEISWCMWGIPWVHWGCLVHQGFPYKLKSFCPPHASWYPPRYWTSLNVLIISPDVLMVSPPPPQCTEHTLYTV